MTHEHAKDLIAALVLDGLDPTEEAELAQHLTECESCSAELATFQKLWHDIPEASAPLPSAGARRRLMESIAKVRGGGRSRPSGWPWWLHAAAALVLLVGGAFAGSTYQKSRVATPGGPAGPRYLMLMRGIDFAEAADTTIAPDFRTWMGRLQEEQRLVGGEAIGDSTGLWAGRQPASLAMDGAFQLNGFMMIQAGDLSEAWQIALQAPHLRGGGAVEIWPVRQ